eukprot:4884169-Pyramimonas_sp.AAC.1
MVPACCKRGSRVCRVKHGKTTTEKRSSMADHSEHVRCTCSSGVVQVRFRYSAGVVRVRFKCGSSAVQAWVKCVSS